MLVELTRSLGPRKLSPLLTPCPRDVHGRHQDAIGLIHEVAPRGEALRRRREPPVVAPIHQMSPAVVRSVERLEETRFVTTRGHECPSTPPQPRTMLVVPDNPIQVTVMPPPIVTGVTIAPPPGSLRLRSLMAEQLVRAQPKDPYAH